MKLTNPWSGKRANWHNQQQSPNQNKQLQEIIDIPPEPDDELYDELPYRTKLWRGENFGKFGESSQFAKFFSPKFPMKHENAGKPWIRQSFFRQYFKIIISPNFFTAKVLFYTVYSYRIIIPS